jgi:hypothetical protein
MALRLSICAACLAVSIGAFACNSSNQNEPAFAPSSDQPGYAARYPDELTSTRGRFSEHEAKARESMGKFAGYPDELQNPSWPDVVAVYQAADSAGHTAEYVHRAKEVQHVAQFFNDEKAEINKKVGGAAQYAAKQKGCDADLSGANATRRIASSTIARTRSASPIARSSRSRRTTSATRAISCASRSKRPSARWKRSSPKPTP